MGLSLQILPEGVVQPKDPRASGRREYDSQWVVCNPTTPVPNYPCSKGMLHLPLCIGAVYNHATSSKARHEVIAHERRPLVVLCVCQKRNFSGVRATELRMEPASAGAIKCHSADDQHCDQRYEGPDSDQHGLHNGGESRLTTKLSDGAPTHQHAGAQLPRQAQGQIARGRALYAKRRSLQRLVRRHGA